MNSNGGQLAGHVLAEVARTEAGETRYPGVDVLVQIEQGTTAESIAEEAECEETDGQIVAVRFTVPLLQQTIEAGGDSGSWNRYCVTVIATPAANGAQTILRIEK